MKNKKIEYLNANIHQYLNNTHGMLGSVFIYSDTEISHRIF